ISQIDTQINPEGPGGDPVDGLAYQPPASQDGDEGRYGREQHACAPQKQHHAEERERETRLGVGSLFLGQLPAEPPEVCASFDGKWEAFIRNFNVFVKPVGDHPAFPLSFDGTENNHYTLRSIAWSPDSKKL